jgi:hypothetical protein
MTGKSVRGKGTVFDPEPFRKDAGKLKDSNGQILR